MAPHQSHPKQSHTKLPKLPSNTRIKKRPLPRPPVPALSSSSQQIIYISTTSPFMSHITRLRKAITALRARRTQSIHATASNTLKAQKGKRKGDKILAAAMEGMERRERGELEEIVVQGSGKAVGKVLAIAGWLQERTGEEGVRVRLGTKSWWAVDDLVVGEEEEEQEGDGEVVPDSRMRRVSILMVYVGVL